MHIVSDSQTGDGATPGAKSDVYDCRVFALKFCVCPDNSLDGVVLFVQDYYVVLLTPSELDPTMKLILQVPIWAARVIYIQGSALKDSDLSRCRLSGFAICSLEIYQ